MSPRPPSASVQRTAPLFAALGDETRLYVIAQLCANGPMSIARLTEGSDVTRQAVTKHLAVLEQAGLVRGYRAGRERVWELEPDRLDDARRTLDFISDRWDAALARLKRLVEE
jgi:DNA-binding transcriptional ArsR family regulator